jgi:hypothetical protein
MKIKKANHILFLILLSLSWVTSEYILSTVQTNRGSQSHGENLPVHPSYSQICSRRINKLDITSNRLDDDEEEEEEEEGTIIAIDSSGIKVSNRGQ